MTRPAPDPTADYYSRQLPPVYSSDPILSSKKQLVQVIDARGEQIVELKAELAEVRAALARAGDRATALLRTQGEDPYAILFGRPR